ncbi:MAG: hypothetical protein ACRC1V_09880 [Plesiomonas sp.]
MKSNIFIAAGNGPPVMSLGGKLPANRGGLYELPKKKSPFGVSKKEKRPA